jgi:serine protease Do
MDRSFTRMLGMAVVLSLFARMALSAELSRDAQGTLRAATFEVVQLKPEEAGVTYERPLPMELMPYQQRTDKYRSIGTAFALGANRYVTAGHVIILGLMSQFGPPALRDESGTVYPIDQVLAYSQHEDFVVFSLRDGPKNVKYLKTGPKPKLNDTVFAVGNALGEGVVIRDGLYTSDTPEEQDGKWSWLRFSAAASPGNSGGPLVDERGRVLGVVLRKSPSENLNFALSINQVLDATPGEAKLDRRVAMHLPIMDVAETMVLDEHFVLPKGLGDFYKTWLQITMAEMHRGVTQLLEHNATHLFPRGDGSERLLHFVERAAFPVMLRESQNGVWVMTSPKPQTVQLEHNGFIEWDSSALRLHAPDDLSVVALHDRSKVFMDLFLNAYPLRRAVGSDSVRVTSLGDAIRESNYADHYGRTWQVRTWAVPYEDTLLTAITLPTPEGSAGFFVKSPSGYSDMVIHQTEVLLDYVFVTLEGTLERWQTYLGQKNLQPSAFAALKLTIEPERRVLFQSPRCEIDVQSKLVKLSKEATLRVNFAFFRDRDAPVWDVAGIALREDAHTQNGINVWRKSQPSSEAPENLRTDWNKAKGHDFPYSSSIANESGETRISTTVAAAGSGDSARTRYGLRVVSEGTQPQEAMARKLELLERAVKVLEQ